MELSKRALGFLCRKYRSVLHKNRMLNALGGVVLAGSLVLGSGIGSVLGVDTGSVFVSEAMATGISSSDSGVFKSLTADDEGAITINYDYTGDDGSKDYGLMLVNRSSAEQLTYTVDADSSIAIKDSESGSGTTLNALVIGSSSTTAPMLGNVELAVGAALTVTGNVSISGMTDADTDTDAVGMLTVNNTMTVSGDTTVNLGTLTVNDGGKYTSSSYTTVNSGTLTVNDGGKYTSSGNTTVYGGTLNVSGADAAYSSSATTINSGSFVTISDGGSYTSSGTMTNSAGDVNTLVVSDSILSMNGGSYESTSNGATSINAGGSITVANGTFTTAGETIVNTDGSSLIVDIGGTYTTTDTMVAPGGNLTVIATGIYNATGVTNLSSDEATSDDEGGMITVLEGGTYNATGLTRVYDYGVLSVEGTYNAAGGTDIVPNGSLIVDEAGVYKNTGTLNVYEDGYVGNEGTLNTTTLNVSDGYVYNKGTLTADTFNMAGGIFTNADGTTTVGTAEMTGGAIKVDNGTFAIGSMTDMTNSTINVAEDAAFTVNNILDICDGSTLTNLGKVSVGGTLAIGGNLITDTLIVGTGTADNGQVVANSVHVDADWTVASGTNINVTSAVAGALNIAENANLDVSAGTLTATAADVVQVEGILTISDANMLVEDTWNSSTLVKDAINLKDDGDTTSGTLAVAGLDVTSMTAEEASAYVATIQAGVSDVTFDATSAIGNNILLNGVTIVGMDASGSVDDLSNKTTANSDSITVTGDGGTLKESTIAAPSLVSESGNAIKELTLNETTITLDASTASAGANTATSVTALTVSDSNSAVNIQNGASLKATDLTVTNGAVTVENNASLEATDLTVADGTVTVQNNASLEANKVTLTDGAMKILNTMAVSFKEFVATGGTLFVDPAYVSIDSVTDDAFGTSLYLGEGGMVSIGTFDSISDVPTWLKTVATSNGLTNSSGNVSAFLLGQSITLGSTGKIILDNDVQADGTGSGYTASGNGGDVYIGTNGLLAVDLSSFSGTDTVISGTGTVTVADGKIYLHNASTDDDGVKLFDGFTMTADDVDDALIATDDRMLNVALNTSNTTTTIGVATNSATSAFPGISAGVGSLVEYVWNNSLNDVDSSNAGLKFISRAANSTYLSESEAAKTVESAMQMGAVAGVASSTMSVATTGAGTVSTRTSFASPLGSAKPTSVALTGNEESLGLVADNSGSTASNKNGVGLWLLPMYQSNVAYGMESGGFETGYNSDFGGLALGADYTFNNIFRMGVSLQLGSGYSTSNGDLSETTNNFTSWGLSLYGGMQKNNFAIMGDVGYTSVYNSVEQDIPSSMGMGNLENDINSSAWTVGLRAEYKWETSAMDIIPHVGVRYINVQTSEYDVQSYEGTLFSVDGDNQSVWTFPVGVTFSKDIVGDSGWTFTPQLDLGFIAAAGDMEATSNISIPGIGGGAELTTKNVDGFAFDGGVGFEVSNENVVLGLNYSVQVSEHTTGQMVYGTLRYEF